MTFNHIHGQPKFVQSTLLQAKVAKSNTTCGRRSLRPSIWHDARIRTLPYSIIYLPHVQILDIWREDTIEHL